MEPDELTRLLLHPTKQRICYIVKINLKYHAPHSNMWLDLYSQALYHTLPVNYITVSKLQNKLEGEASLNTVRKLIDKMAQDGFLEATSNRRLGK